MWLRRHLQSARGSAPEGNVMMKRNETEGMDMDAGAPQQEERSGRRDAGDVRRKGAKEMDNSTRIEMSQAGVFQTDAIALAKAACPVLTYGEWEVVLNALNGHRDAVMMDVDRPEDDQIIDVLSNTRPNVSDAAHMAAGTHPDWPEDDPVPDGPAASLTHKYPVWTDTQWLAVSLLAQAFWHFGLPADGLPLVGD